ncbi:MAG: LysR substrate-binding domain-containing protein [Hyphomicrobiales bacterium]|nr:LysR substrate-binding domain-containing protein [Hyphomicrobiales bacterium]
MVKLNIRQVEVFKAIMEAGSVTSAAGRMNVTQPSLSKHLKLLEAELDVCLFDRTGNRLVPTAEARAFYDQIERTYLGLDNLARFADDLSNNRHGEILLAAMPLIAHSWLPNIIAKFLVEHENVSMSLPVRSSRWIGEWVAAGRVDFGIGLSTGDDKAILTEPLLTVPLVCAIPTAHRLERYPVIEPSHLDGEMLISLSNFDHWRLAVESALESHKVKPRSRVDTFTTYTACELVCRGLGVAIVDAITAKKYAGANMTWRPFKPGLAFEIFLMRPRHWQVSRLGETLIELIKLEAEKSIGEF